MWPALLRGYTFLGMESHPGAWGSEQEPPTKPPTLLFAYVGLAEHREGYRLSGWLDISSGWERKQEKASQYVEQAAGQGTLGD